MKNRKGFIILFTLCHVISCNKEEDVPKYFNHKFYAVHKTPFDWEKNSFFNNQPVSLRLESRMNFEDRSWQGRFESIVENTMNVYLDRNLFIGNDTILSGNNLLLPRIAEIELYKTSLNNELVSDSYIIWLNKQDKFSYSVNKGYYTVYISGQTENKNKIHDSAVIFIQ